MSNIEQKLGFDRIKQMVAEQCTNALAVRMADEMHYMTYYEPLYHELKLVEEMRQIVLMESSFPQQDFIDLTPILTHLRVGKGVGALFCHHLLYAVKPQFLFYIAHLVKVKVKGPALAEGGQFLFVKGDGNGLFAHAFGYRQPFVIYCRAVAAVAAAHAVHAAAIAPHGVA